MNTQQIGNDIVVDVTFEFRGIPAAFFPTYEFKGSVVWAGATPGEFIITVQRGEGIDLAHAEVVVEQGQSDTSLVATPGLAWSVTQLAATADGEVRYRVFFTQPIYDSTPVPDTVTPTGADPSWASVTVRRKIPSVN
jgi:hypothetical protein